MVEDQAGRGRMGVQLAVRADDAALGRGDLTPRMDHPALGTHERNAVVEGRTMFTLSSSVVKPLPAGNVA